MANLGAAGPLAGARDAGAIAETVSETLPETRTEAHPHAEPDAEPVTRPVRSTDETREYQIKSAFLFNFTKYVKWPVSAFKDTRAPLVLAVLGADPFGAMLDKDCAGKTVNGRKIVVKRFASVKSLDACHLLFVPASEAGNGALLAQRYAGSSVLIVGESKGFAEHYGLINFYIEKKKVNFEVNVDSVKREKLDISSQLLKLARIVKTKQ